MEPEDEDLVVPFLLDSQHPQLVQEAKMLRWCVRFLRATDVYEKSFFLFLLSGSPLLLAVFG